MHLLKGCDFWENYHCWETWKNEKRADFEIPLLSSIFEFDRGQPMLSLPVPSGWLGMWIINTNYPLFSWAMGYLQLLITFWKQTVVTRTFRKKFVDFLWFLQPVEPLRQPNPWSPGLQETPSFFIGSSLLFLLIGHTWEAFRIIIYSIHTVCPRSYEKFQFCGYFYGGREWYRTHKICLVPFKTSE